MVLVQMVLDGLVLFWMILWNEMAFMKSCQHKMIKSTEWSTKLTGTCRMFRKDSKAIIPRQNGYCCVKFWCWIMQSLSLTPLWAWHPYSVSDKRPVGPDFGPNAVPSAWTLHFKHECSISYVVFAENEQYGSWNKQDGKLTRKMRWLSVTIAGKQKEHLLSYHDSWKKIS